MMMSINPEAFSYRVICGEEFRQQRGIPRESEARCIAIREFSEITSTDLIDFQMITPHNFRLRTMACSPRSNRLIGLIDLPPRHSIPGGRA